MRPTRTTTIITTAITIGAAFGLAACSGSSSTAADASTSTSVTLPAGVSGLTKRPPVLPYALGTRAALGDWELSVDAATVEATTTVQARLVNVTNRAAPAPSPAVFTLRDGVTKLPIPARVDGLPATMQPNVDARITITFVGATAPVDPYLRWNGTTRDAVTADFKLTPGDPTVPLG